MLRGVAQCHSTVQIATITFGSRQHLRLFYLREGKSYILVEGVIVFAQLADITIARLFEVELKTVFNISFHKARYYFGTQFKLL